MNSVRDPNSRDETNYGYSELHKCYRSLLSGTEISNIPKDIGGWDEDRVSQDFRESIAQTVNNATGYIAQNPVEGRAMMKSIMETTLSHMATISSVAESIERSAT
ncbi:uncharacterized protein I303_105815 [Kwoniella dejecticola CBS 10117]|uniref:Uncharacterized protein n=1 Tax=Kwoniella dejecticola CBS 10117 TaxID=1296121 RepID=A0A1A6A0G1_9TREE|nr:uncharacterized protein I303_05837 [Kwoniella dejecticola CBS 10117]OBR83557.1 hypothetical protein I303_05837 [Kwoniella dejecticola CBS 10117]